MRRGGGFALLDVMAAVTLWALAVVACGQLLSNAVRTQRAAERRWATVLACRCALETACVNPGVTGDTLHVAAPSRAFAISDSVSAGMLRVRAFSRGERAPRDTVAVFSRAVWRGAG
ncbi:hypothetical protein JXA88_08575 [Candidatus Fermentibacteria bacterium]|nr:hypothetical protein [Candidatus Fermentibacteria bacterium]